MFLSHVEKKNLQLEAFTFALELRQRHSFQRVYNFLESLAILLKHLKSEFLCVLKDFRKYEGEKSQTSMLY